MPYGGIRLVMNVEDIKKDFPLLENREITYLDNGATAQKPIQVIKAIEEFYERCDEVLNEIYK